jgi:hypothetical protein
LDAVALIAELVVHLLQAASVVVVNWDMGMGGGTLAKRNAKLKYAASGINSLKPVLIVATTLTVI